MLYRTVLFEFPNYLWTSTVSGRQLSRHLAVLQTQLVDVDECWRIHRLTHTQARRHTHTAPLSSVTSIFFSINPFSLAASFRAQDSLESAGASPTCLGAKVAHRTSRQQAKFTLAYTPTGNLQSPIHLTYMLLDCECKAPV